MFHREEKIYLPWSNQRYSISRKGVVSDGEIPVREFFIDGEKVVELEWCCGKKPYPYDTIAALCFFKIKITPKLLGGVRLIFKDLDRNNTSIDNLAYRFETPVESEEYPGYYYVPYYTDFLIDRAGNTVSLRYLRQGRSFKHKTWTISKPVLKKRIKGGYRCGRGRRDHDNASGATRHRFLALTFIPYTEDPLSLVVNHKNGIPGDDRIENLEWVTYSENTKHAYLNNLHPNKVVKVMTLDEETGEVVRYPTIADCAERTGLSCGCISSRLEKPTVRYHGELRVKYDDGSDWVDVEHSRKPSFSRSVMAKNIFTGDIIIFENKNRAEELTGIGKGTISYHCDTETMIPTRGYSFRYTDIDAVWPNYSEYHLRMYRRFTEGYIPNGLFLLDENNDVKEFYECFTDFATHAKIKVSRIYSMMKWGKKWNGLHLRKFDVRAPL